MDEKAAVCGACLDGAHEMCAYYGRKRFWAPCGCEHESHKGVEVLEYK